ncbi:HAMP domain-containing sensor histidine kinase [Actinomycetota bacterium]
MPLIWRLVIGNGIVFTLGTVLLAVLPLTVSTRVAATEAAVLAVGLSVLLVLNALLMRHTLAPLQRLERRMAEVDPLVPGERLRCEGSPETQRLISAFNAMQDRLEGERSTSNARALAAQEGERRRIAQELHDEIGQSLTVVLLGLKRVIDRAPEDLRDDLSSVQTAARSSLTEVRQVAHRLRPGALEDLGLTAAISSLATELSSSAGLSVHRRIARVVTDDPEVDLVVYRVAQEALTNIARHSGARTVEITLAQDGDGVILTVEDDGVGAPAGAVLSEGAGIRGMRERALLVRGDLRVEPSASGGTRVRLDVPLRRKA